MKKILLLLCVALALKACDTKAEEENSVADNTEEARALPAYALLQEVAPTLSDSVKQVLIIPVDVACPACRDKSIDFVKQYQPSTLLSILTSAGKKPMDKFLREKEVDTSRADIVIDSKNYCFLKDLVFMKPTIYYIESKRIVAKVELVPLNIDEELAKLLPLEIGVF
jgi:hypothetical protein